MMALKYQSTRDLNQTKITPTKAILSGLSHDGGLFVPDKLPKLDLTLTQLPHLSYQELALKILQPSGKTFKKPTKRNGTPLKLPRLKVLAKLITWSFSTDQPWLLKMLPCSCCRTSC